MSRYFVNISCLDKKPNLQHLKIGPLSSFPRTQSKSRSVNLFGRDKQFFHCLSSIYFSSTEQNDRRRTSPRLREVLLHAGPPASEVRGAPRWLHRRRRRGRLRRLHVLPHHLLLGDAGRPHAAHQRLHGGQAGPGKRTRILVKQLMICYRYCTFVFVHYYDKSKCFPLYPTREFCMVVTSH